MSYAEKQKRKKEDIRKRELAHAKFKRRRKEKNRREANKITRQRG
jgi:hypothetical protein